MIPAFLSCLDFWGTLLDLFGLAVLMSQDIDALKFLDNCVRQFPSMNRLQLIANRFQDAIKQFENAFPPLQEERRLDSVQGKEAAVVVAIFPNIRERPIPNEIDLCGCYIGQSFFTAEILVWAARKGTFSPLLTAPIPETVFRDKLDKKRRNFTYTAGFMLMAAGSVLVLLGIVFKNL